MKRFMRFFFPLIILIIALCVYFFKNTSKHSTIPIAKVIKQDLKVEIKTVGELEAARSLSIASNIKGDQGKIISLVSDGIYVKSGDLLLKMDPTPFEEKIEKLQVKIKEQEAYVHTLEKALEWEISQAEHLNRTADFEVESARLELDKILYGDGPQETYRLKGAMQKAWLKFDELNSYSEDLKELQEKGFLNVSEVKQALKKLNEEQEAYETARQQYESYINHVLPIQIKKGETSLKRAEISREDTLKAGVYNISKANALLEQSKQNLMDHLIQLKEAEKELVLSEILAPSPGMVVLREEYRQSQRRKPRVGDILVKNQPLIDLPDLSSMIVKTRVREVDLFKIDIGKKAIIEVDAYPQLAFEGTVTSIGVLALSDIGRSSEEKYFEVKVVLNENDARLRPGMTTRVTILAQEKSDVLTIPIHTVFNEQKRNFCFLENPHSFEMRDIVLGISNEQWVEVISGLEEGEHICLLNPFQ